MIENEDAVCRSVIQAWLAMELKGLEGLMYSQRDTDKWLENRKRIVENCYIFFFVKLIILLQHAKSWGNCSL